MPDELLVARDDGAVMFFCGAGVSLASAGLPDFWQLASQVIEELGVDHDDQSRKLIDLAGKIRSTEGIDGLVSADRVFGLLEREFSDQDIEAAVAKALKPPSNVDLSSHRIMLDLSTTADGNVRLVTTNFDLLFEMSNSGLRQFAPPGLPDPRYALEGIIHLHGHANADYSGASKGGFVLTSSKFGQAYLSEAWATQFIRQILEKYLIVFVGYSADDPPVQYLLEALNRTSGAKIDIYAFQAGPSDYAEARWRQKGVFPIVYNASDRHKALWQTLLAWSVRAQSPEQWEESVVQLARKGPDALLPHERGQVAHLTSTVAGARRFASADPAPPASWLCVFDRNERYAIPSRRRDGEQPYSDPFESLGLDSDTPPSTIDPGNFFAKRAVPPAAWDCFTVGRMDRLEQRDDLLPAFRGVRAATVPRVSSRLFWVSKWLVNVCTEPITLWWASGQSSLHPDVRDRLRSALIQDKCTPEMRRAWRHLLNASDDADDEYKWFELDKLVKFDGWSHEVVRELAYSVRPYLKVSRPLGQRRPSSTVKPEIHDLVSFEVEYPDLPIEANIPDSLLVVAVREFRQNLLHAVYLETEIGGWGLRRIPPIEEESDTDGTTAYNRAYGVSKALFAYVRLFRRLIDVNVTAASEERLAWPTDNEEVFTRLRIWLCLKRTIIVNSEVGQIISDLKDDVFWGSWHQRDLLLALKERWNDLASGPRTTIEMRLLSGRVRHGNESDYEYHERRAWSSLNRIHWLANSGCKFSFDLAAETKLLEAHAKDWKLKYAEKAAASLEGKTGWVRTETDHKNLLTVPLANILAEAEKLSGRTGEPFVENDPYAGLVATQPVRSFSALTLTAEAGNYPRWAWRTFFNAERRKSDAPRFTVLIAGRLGRIPEAVLAELIYPAAEWFVKVSPVLSHAHPRHFDSVWSKLISTLRSQVEVVASSVRKTTKERDWGMESLTSPAGRLAQVLLDYPDSEQLKAGAGLDATWIDRADQLLSLGGDFRRHAIVMFAQQLPWLFWVDPIWTQRAVLPAFDSDDDDRGAVWAGFSWGIRRPPQTELYQRIKSQLLDRVARGGILPNSEQEVLGAVLLSGWMRTNRPADTRVITNDEMRQAALRGGEQFRLHLLWNLKSYVTDTADGHHGTPDVLIFLKEVWPRQKRAKSPRTSARLCDLACVSKTAFPAMVDVILPLLTTIDSEEHIGLAIRNSANDIVSLHPEKTLALLFAVLPDSATMWPYGIDSVIERIETIAPSLLRDRRLLDLKRRQYR